MSALIVKGVLFALLLLAAAVWDIKRREIPNMIPVLILACGLLCFEPLNAIKGLLFTGLPYFLAAIFVKRSGLAIGGGDIKLMAACGFVLGVWAGVLQSVLSLFLAVLSGIVTAFIMKQKFEDVKIPLAPCFCVGGILSFAAVVAASI